MSLYPEPPFEFLVEGTAVSLQSSPDGKAAWKEKVEAAARAALPSGNWLLEGPLSITIYVFPSGDLPGDIDNLVKPILDAMIHCVYFDDSGIERVVVQKFEPTRIFEFRDPSTALQSALDHLGPIVYIRISDDPHEELS